MAALLTNSQPNASQSAQYKDRKLQTVIFYLVIAPLPTEHVGPHNTWSSPVAAFHCYRDNVVGGVRQLRVFGLLDTQALGSDTT